MENSNSKGKEVVVDIESCETSHGAHVKRDPISGNKQGQISLNKHAGGVLNNNGSADGEAMVNSDGLPGESVENPYETMELLVDKNPGEQQSEGPVPLVEKDHEKERRKAGKVKKAPKPPRPPKAPSLDAADMRLIKEITKIAMKKRERIERIKALKKLQTARLPAPSTSLLSSCGITVFATVITVLFLLVLVFQGFGANTRTHLTLKTAPQLAPETTGLMPPQFYKTVLSDDGAVPSFVPTKRKE